MARLREMAARVVDGSLCSADDFANGFPTLSASHPDVLQHVYLQAQGCLRENASVRGRRRRLNAHLPCDTQPPRRSVCAGRV